MVKIKISKRIGFGKNKFFKELPRLLAERAFLTFLFLSFISLVAGAVVFYKYVVVAQKTEIEADRKPIEIKENLYQDILKVWQEREQKLKETESKKYPDLFASSTPELLPVSTTTPSH